MREKCTPVGAICAATTDNWGVRGRRSLVENHAQEEAAPHDRLPSDAHGARPPPPLVGAAWAATPPLSKRMCLRDQVEWADAHGCLDAIYALLKDVPEDQWHHMGE
jgi:hypothetical protein